jgi:hypothetical protein
MTAQTIPAQPAEDTSPRPLPWRRMTGVIWRQHRFALVGVAVLLGALAVYLGIVGAPLLAREMETGTFRYTWTQGFGRRRWALAKLAALGLAVTIAAELFSLVLGWYYQPYFATGNYSLALNEMSPFNSGLFDLNRVTFAAWALAAFAIGALAGMLISRRRSDGPRAVSVTRAVRGGR